MSFILADLSKPTHGDDVYFFFCTLILVTLIAKNAL